MGWMQNRQNQARTAQDRFTRDRFRQHQHSMSTMGQGGRMAEREAAHRANPSNFDESAWHSYLAGSGSRPSSGGYGGGAPTMGEMPTYEKPEYDEDKVSALTQKRAAGGIRNLREATQEATSGTYDNPNVKRMTVRDALKGYGTGLENVMGGAGQAARAEYGQQYAAEVGASMANFNAAVNRQSQEYNTQSQSYLMGQEQNYWEQQQDYNSDPYADFQNFYG